MKEAGVWSVMGAYNRVNGESACCEPRAARRDPARASGVSTGYVVSDCGAIDDIYENHKIARHGGGGVCRWRSRRAAISNCGVEYAELLPAVKQGLIAEAEIDVALRRLLTARFRLGMFDPPETVAYARIPYA